MAAVFPSAHNTFTRSLDATNKLKVEFSRNAADFALNRYTQIVPVKKVAGYYLRMTVEEAGRILNTDLRDFVWHDSQPASEGNEGAESHEFFPYECARYQFPRSIGDLTVSQADWDILAQYSRIKAQQAMTARTQAVITEFTTQANYDSSHVLNVTTITGNTGNWAASTTATQNVKRSLNTAAEVILDDTLAGVDPNDLLLVMNSALASDLSLCQEIVDHVKGSPEAFAQVRGELPGRNAMYGLPDKLYGFPVVVEKTRKVTTVKGATTSRSQVLTTSTPFMCARPGGLQGTENAPSFSTVTLFMLEEMTVETKRDDDNRRTRGRVVENYDVKMTAPASGVLFTNCTS